jgi:hypothetical protein
MQNAACGNENKTKYSGIAGGDYLEDPKQAGAQSYPLIVS